MATELIEELRVCNANVLTNYRPQPKYGVCKVVSVYDGDTLTVAAKFADSISKYSVRLIGLDCPEIRGRGKEEKEVAIAIRDYVRSLCMNEICKINVKDLDKWGRLMASIELPCGNDLASHVLDLRIARPYNGGTRSPFTEEELRAMMLVLEDVRSK